MGQIQLGRNELDELFTQRLGTRGVLACVVSWSSSLDASASLLVRFSAMLWTKYVTTLVMDAGEAHQ